MLIKKMFRDILKNKGSYIACLVIVMIGLIVYTSFSIASDSLKTSKNNFYEEQNFADGFIELTSIPKSQIDSILNIQGIKNVTGRFTNELRVFDSAKQESVYIKLVSLDLAETNRVNDVKLIEGRALDKNQMELWIDNKFYDANNLQLEKTIQLIAKGGVREATVSGVGMSPEFTYPLRTQAELFPNPDQYGIGFLSYDNMARLFPESRGNINSIVFTLENNVEFENIKHQLESLLSSYGVINIYPREQQVSHLMLNQEVETLENISKSMPIMFLTIAAIILYIIQKRLLEQQRGQIGLLKSFGYSNKEIITHYLMYSVFIGGLGGALGGIIGVILANPLTAMLFQFFNVPKVFTGFSFGYVATGLFLSLAIFLIAGYQGCKKILLLLPAEAMKAPVPVFGKHIIFERWSFLWNRLTIQGKMALRNLVRNKGRTVFVFLGIALSFSIVALTWTLNDVIDKLMFYQYKEVETYDAKLSFESFVDRTKLDREILSRDGIIEAEPLVKLPVHLTHNWLTESIVVLGIQNSSTLYNVLDSSGNNISLPEEGIILSERLAYKLQANVGSTLEFESPMLAENETLEVMVQGIIPQYLGMNAYMNLSALENLIGSSKIATSFIMNLQNYSDDMLELRDYFLKSDFVIGFDTIQERVAAAEELMDSFGSVIYIYLFVGIIICFAIIYSSTFITLSERERELASMRVLGMTNKEVFSVITFEQWFISVFSMLLGIPLAFIMVWGMATQLSTDMYTIPSDLSPQSIIIAIVLVIFSIWSAQRFAVVNIRNLNFVDALKSAE